MMKEQFQQPIMDIGAYTSDNETRVTSIYSPNQNMDSFF